MAENQFPEEFGNPAYWMEVIKDDINSEERREWEKNIITAKRLVKNEFDPQVAGVDNRYWYKTASYIRKRNYLLGRLAFGKMEAKVTGTEVDDMDTAEMYRALINFEFNRPRGLKRKVGRRQIAPCLGDWIDFGMGAYNTYFDPYIRSAENWTGSIINERVDATGVYLDHTARSLDEIGHFSRRFDISEPWVRQKFPGYKGDVPVDEKGRAYLNEVQFRTHKYIEAKLNSPEVAELMQDYRPHWKLEEEDNFKSKYKEGRKGDGRTLSAEARNLWNSMNDDLACIPMCYSLMFLSNGRADASSNPIVALLQEPKYIGADFSVTFIPFISLPDTPYPVGVPYYINDITQLEIIFKTLYARMMIRVNNSGGVVNVDKLAIGTDDINAKIAEVQRLSAEYGYFLPVSGVENMNAVIQQMKYESPSKAMLEIGEACKYEGDEFFNTHREQMGQTPFAGASGELVKTLQAAGGAPLGHMVDSVDFLLSSIFRKMAYLCYKYMPTEKKVALSDLPANKETMVIKREQIQKYDPNDLDITAQLNLDSEQEKVNRANKALLAFQSGVMGPKKFLQELGYRDYEEMLTEVGDYQMGQQIVNIMKADKEFASQVSAGLKAKALELEDAQRSR